ncbi:hypothetical protein ACFC9G_15685 [Enterococcus casseliflavus]|uniref:hypothetical protein n=1 Tax=Enterococcus casseliflavus TaxID=37734 RepID=UPI0039A75D08
MRKWLADIWKNWETIIKIVGGILLGVIFSALIVGIMMKIPKLPFIGGDEDGWMGFWGGIFGSLFGVMGAYLVMRAQINAEKVQKEEEFNPILILGKGKRIVFKRDTLNEKNMELPLINGGQTPVTNIEISYFIPDEMLLDFIKDSSWHGDFIEIRSENEIMHIRRTGEMQYIPILMPGEKQDIELSFTANIFYFEYIKSFTKDDFNIKYKNFKIKIILKYQDYKNKTRVTEFYVSVNLNHAEWNHKGEIKKLSCTIENDNAPS